MVPMRHPWPNAKGFCNCLYNLENVRWWCVAKLSGTSALPESARTSFFEHGKFCDRAVENVL